jgi:hypothetical protein
LQNKSVDRDGGFDNFLGMRCRSFRIGPRFKGETNGPNHSEEALGRCRRPDWQLSSVASKHIRCQPDGFFLARAFSGSKHWR